MKLANLKSLRKVFRKRPKTGVSPVRDWGIMLATTTFMFIACVVLGVYSYLDTGTSVNDIVVQNRTVDLSNDDISEILELLRTRRTQVEERMRHVAPVATRTKEQATKEDPINKRATSSAPTPVIAE